MSTKKIGTPKKLKQPLVKRNVTYPRKLNDQELLQSVETEKENQKALTAEYKSRVERLNADVNECGVKLRSGTETMTELCIIEFDTKRNKAMAYRMEKDKKGEFVIEQPMSGEDRQTLLVFEQDARNETEAAKREQQSKSGAKDQPKKGKKKKDAPESPPAATGETQTESSE